MSRDPSLSTADVEAIRRSEIQLRTIFTGAPVGISLVDAEGRYVAVNPARQQMLGYSEAELVGRSYLDVTHPDDVPYDEAINAEARELGKDRYQLEKRFLRKDGSVIWSRITVSVVRDDRGEIEYSVSVAEDITKQKAAQEELERLYRLERMTRSDLEQLAAERSAILRQIAEGIIIADSTGAITFVNEAARAIHGVAVLGVGPDEYAEQYHLRTTDGRPYPSRDLPLARAVLHGETVVGGQWRVHRPDGIQVVAEGSAAPVIGEDGQRLGAVLTIRDITAEYDLERQKDEFLSAAAHDLRTPLTTIKGRIQLLRKRAGRGDGPDTKHLVEELSRIDASAGRMMSLINELLDVANIQIGRTLKLNREPTDLVALARAVAAEHYPESELHPVSLETKVLELIGRWDQVRLERMLSNLISNAIKYSPDGGEVTVTVGCEEDNRWAVLAVRDQGVGIPAADLPHIFERFRRGGNVSGKISGTGIGLAAVRRIVEEHGGSISVESREGQGTTFIVRLPLSA